MALFQYSAEGPTGTVSGQLMAADRAEAFAVLGRQRLQPFRLVQEEPAAPTQAQAAQKKNLSSTESQTARHGAVRLKLSQVVLFAEEISDLLGAGIRLEPALATMERRRELSGIKTLAATLRAHLREGMSFARALTVASPSFGSLFCALAAAGEASGMLPQILKRQAAYLRTLQTLRSKVLFALIYPSFLLAAAIAVTLLFIVYLIPKLTLMLDATGGSLPLGAQVVMHLSDFLKATWWLLALGGFTLWLAFRAWRALPSSAVPWSRFRLRVPFMGPMLRERFHVQFLETLSNLSSSGLPMIHALQLTQQATDNAFLQRELGSVIAHVREGVSLSRALERSGHFPPLLLDMVNVGEQTGDLPTALARAAERYDRELTKRIEKLTALVQPAIVCLMAGLVGVMAYLMVTTIFQTISGLGTT